MKPKRQKTPLRRPRATLLLVLLGVLAFIVVACFQQSDPADVLPVPEAGGAGPEIVMMTVNGQPVSTDNDNYLLGSAVTISGGPFKYGTYQVPVIRPDGTVRTVDAEGAVVDGWASVEVPVDGTLEYVYDLVDLDGRYEARIYPASWEGDLSQTPLATDSFDAGTFVSDRDDYAPGETVSISASGFDPSTDYDIAVTRPDGSVIKGDGNFNEDGTYTCPDPATDPNSTGDACWDAVTTDATGFFGYSYVLNGIVGEYIVEVYSADWTGPASAEQPVATMTFTDATGNFTLDFTAAAPFTYDHATGGGSFDDRTIGKSNDVVESLEGGDFRCGDIVTYLLRVRVKNEASAVTDSQQTIRVNMSFLADTTGQSGAAHSKIEFVGVNSGAIARFDVDGNGTLDIIGDGPGETDGGFTEGGVVGNPSNSAVLNPVSGLTGPLFQAGSRLNLTFDLNNLGATLVNGSPVGDAVVVRIDVRLACKPFSRPTGNLQGAVTGATLEKINGDGDGGSKTINVGNQTIPFKQFGQLPIATVTIVKDANPEGDQTFNYMVDPPLLDVDVNDGSTTEVDDFTLVDDGTGNQDSRSFVVSPEDGGSTFDFTEDVPGGWELDDITCTGTDAWTDDLPSASVDVTLVDGDDVTCTFTNEKKTELKLVKEVTNDDGGDAVADDWTLSATAAAPNAGRNFDNLGGSGAFTQVFANVGYDLSESVVAGYTAGSWSCDGGTLNGSTITLGFGDQVTCTITNDDVAPTLKLVKTVTNDDGGDKVADDWNLSANAAAPDDGRNFSNAGGSGVFETVFANAGYDLSESVVAGYTAGSWSCDGGTLVGSTVTLGLDDDVTCTINNDDTAPTLKLVKTVINDNGGTAVAGDWTLSATAAAPDDGRNFSNAGDAGGFETVFANAGYDLAESDVPGYTAGAWLCDGGDQLNSTITLSPGDEVTCTINNDDIAPTLKLVKTVTTDDGGDAVPDDWTLSATAAAPDDGFNFSNAGGSGAFQDVIANVGYVLAESVVAGYTAGDWSCDGGTLVGSTVTLGLDDDVTCTINNDDTAPTLKLVKAVNNDDGGDKVAGDWTLSATAAAPDGGRNFSNAGDAGVFETVFANAGYDLAETNVPGYTAGAWLCDGGDQLNSTITLKPGDRVTCTITNDDDPPTLKLVKAVNNDDGGDKVADDWTLSADAAAPDGGRNFSNAGGSGAFETVFANVGYDLSESVVAGYTAGDWSCDGGTQSGASITLDLGDAVTCTIENDDIAPTLKLVKLVDNGANPGGTANADEWDLTAESQGSDSSRDISTPGGSHDFETVFANAGYELAEDGPLGYQIKNDWSCNGGIQSNSTITLDLDEHVTCTIENEALGMVEVLKLTNGSDNQEMTWNFTLTGPGVDESDSSPPTTVDFGNVKLVPGEEYTLCETGIPAGWTTSWQVDTNGDGVPDTIIPMVANVNDDPVGSAGYSRVYDPNYSPDPYTNDTRCVNFVVEVGETLAFQIDNQFPGGEPRTIGFWKNWNTCTGGNQQYTAAENGGPAEGWFILDDLLNAPGYTIGVLTLNAGQCTEAVDILDKRSIDDGRKRASDGAYNLASQLLAAQLNFSAGAETCQEAVDAVNAGQALLVGENFNGTGDYLKGKKANDANLLAATLDTYNNGNLCTP